MGQKIGNQGWAYKSDLSIAEPGLTFPLPWGLSLERDRPKSMGKRINQRHLEKLESCIGRDSQNLELN